MRVQKVERELKKQIGIIFQQDLNDPRIGFVTITEVKLSADLKFAKIYYSVLGNKKQEKKTLDAISKASPYIRRLLARRMILRFVPELKFYYDETFEKAMHVDELLDDFKNDESS
jgi:ribosome-binding factor A